MVIFTSKTGQLANRLWQAAHFISNAIENDYILIHKGFDDYFEYYSNSINCIESAGNVAFKEIQTKWSISNLILKYAGIAIRIETVLGIKLPFIKKLNFLEFNSLRFNLSEKSFIRIARKNIVFVDGWFYQDKISLLKHADKVRQIFTPNSNFLVHPENSYKTQFQKYNYVIGIHIRRGDYKKYRNGIWYYSDEDYAEFMNQTLKLEIFKKKSVAFFICSNEKIDNAVFMKFDVISTTNHLIEDLYTLAKCDYILGPPSTYSAWASFYGNVPVFHIYDKCEKIEESSFQSLIMDTKNAYLSILK